MDADPDYAAAVATRYRARHPGVVERRATEWRKNNPIKARAGTAVSNAIKLGKLVRPTQCEVCPSTRNIHAHHDSYDEDRWLVVAWMCARCHRSLHNQRGNE